MPERAVKRVAGLLVGADVLINCLMADLTLRMFAEAVAGLLGAPLFRAELDSKGLSLHLSFHRGR